MLIKYFNISFSISLQIDMDKLGQSSEIFVISFQEQRLLQSESLFDRLHRWFMVLTQSYQRDTVVQWHSGEQKALSLGVQIPAQSAIPWAGFLTFPILTCWVAIMSPSIEVSWIVPYLHKIGSHSHLVQRCLLTF